MKVFVSYKTHEDLCGQNVLHVNYCPAMCLLKNQSLPLLCYVTMILYDICMSMHNGCSVPAYHSQC